MRTPARWFGLKLDSIDNSLAITALKCKVAEVKQDMSEHTKCIDEAEDQAAASEEELQVEFASTVKRLTNLETKTDSFPLDGLTGLAMSMLK